MTSSEPGVHERESTSLNRRRIVKALSLATVASWLPSMAVHSSDSGERFETRLAEESWQPRFLDSETVETVEWVADCIGHETNGPGARRRAVRYVDQFLSEADGATQQSFRQGLRGLDEFAEERFAQRFIALPAEKRSRLLSLVSDTHHIRQPKAHAFLTHLKQLTIEGYYSKKRA